ncbi:MAG TPA: hypothetical protein VMD03_01305 [Steroidobacteraceae bacterium]|nr:hypothetical protein [Steroidobacteraceae bacterium]
MSRKARAGEERAAALEAATHLLALAMRESLAPVDVLAGALERMALSLARCARSIDAQRIDGAPLGNAAQACQALERDIALCIESLQFHDRLMQRLERVHGSLTGTTGTRCTYEIPCKPAASEGSVELFE